MTIISLKSITPIPGTNSPLAAAVRLDSGPRAAELQWLRDKLRRAQPLHRQLGQAVQQRDQAARLLPAFRGHHAAAAVLVADVPPRSCRRDYHSTTRARSAIARDFNSETDVK